MSWLARHRFKLYIRGSIWVFPVLSIIAALVTVAILNRIDRAFGWEMKLSVETGRTVMGTVAASMFSLVVVGSSALLVVMQLASAQLTPRIIAFIYRNPIRKFCLSLFVFTFTFSVAVLVRIETNVPLLTSNLAAYGFLLNLALFLYFVDGMGKALRPSSAMRNVALAGREVIHDVYPLRLEQQSSKPPIRLAEDNLKQVVLNVSDGVLLAFDRKGLVSMAQGANCLIELAPQVGDFVAAGDPLFYIYQNEQDLNETLLLRSVAFGQERTLEQDPMFALRIIVDIASKALSPAVNDPTTAVLSIDQIHHLLRDLGTRYLAEGRELDSKGQLRLAYRTPNWEDFVHLGVTEIRQYGRDSIQIMRRLRAMLENLLHTLPERRSPPLRQELRLLMSSSKRIFPDVDDQILAGSGDSQGIGGHRDGDPVQHEDQAPAVA